MNVNENLDWHENGHVQKSRNNTFNENIVADTGRDTGRCIMSKWSVEDFEQMLLKNMMYTFLRKLT